MSKDWDPTKTKKYASDEERRLAAYRDWLGGMSYRAVAKKHGYTDHAAAIRAIRRARQTFIDDTAEAREQATERILPALMRMRQVALEEGDPAAANAYKGLEERLAKLLGLDAPVKTDVTSDGQGLVINVVKDWEGDPH